jgi:uncharacterized protein (DUF1800 family)
MLNVLLIAVTISGISGDVWGDSIKEKRNTAKKERSTAASTIIQTGRVELPPANAAIRSADYAETVEPIFIEAGHVLRRIGFGPNKKELKTYKKKGFTNYINEQLNYSSIYDGKALNKLPGVDSNPDKIYDYKMIPRWYIRMVWTRRTLLEKMTLIWHEHFSVSHEKVQSGALMLDHEELLRKHALGNFAQLLTEMSRDQAMLIWLDNDYNRGNEYPPDPPNENYAREFLQLFSTGTELLNLDGTKVLDGSGNPIPAYTEEDILNVALAMTGWNVPWPRRRNNTEWVSWIHNDDPKTLFATDAAGPVTIYRSNENEEHLETADVVNAVLSRRANTVAAFISKILIGKLVTETPSPQYVEAVATVFKNSNWNIKEAVRTILTWSAEGTSGTPEFLKAENMRSLHKEPVEYIVGAIRGLNAKTKGEELIDWTYDMGQLVWWPPSVFSFYPPGNRGALVSTAYVFERDEVADEFVRGWSDTFFNAEKLIGKNDLLTPEDAVSFLENKMLAHPLQPDVRQQMLNYMGGGVNETKFEGLVWLLMCSPDYQRN